MSIGLCDQVVLPNISWSFLMYRCMLGTRRGFWKVRSTLQRTPHHRFCEGNDSAFIYCYTLVAIFLQVNFGYMSTPYIIHHTWKHQRLLLRHVERWGLGSK